jgi:hypothetical protein
MVVVGHFWQPYVGQATGGESNMMVLIGGTEKQAVIHRLSYG